MTAESLPLSGRLGNARRLLAALPRWLYVVAALLVVAAAIAAVIAVTRAQSSAQLQIAPVVRQMLSSTVTAQGTVNAQNSVLVGTQVSGTIQNIYVDYNSKVHEGQVLARLDPSTVQAQLDQARASLAQAQAQLAVATANAGGAQSNIAVANANNSAQVAAIASAQANVNKSQAALTLAQQQLARDQVLFKQGFIAQSTVDADRSNVGQTQGALAAAQAALVQSREQSQASAATVSQTTQSAAGQAANAQAAKAAVGAAQAQVQQDEVNLAHTVITSPVDGTVVARAVSVGQTVAASFNTPTLFTIAQDLRKMEVDINVAEPDIGNVKPRDVVDFSVLAFPNRTFHGTVQTVRINPQTVNNVVTYQVIVDVPNLDGALLPGMTANATINVAIAKNALVVPLAAFQAHAARQSQGSSGASATSSSPFGTVSSANAGSSVTAGQNKTLLVQRDGNLQAVRVHVDLANASSAAVTPLAGYTLREGDSVVVGAANVRLRANSRSPLLPSGPRGPRG